MASTDRTCFPVKGQQFEFQHDIFDSATGSFLTGGLTSLAATISKDGGLFASTTNSPSEIGTTGSVKLVLTATEMSCDGCEVRFSAGNTGAISPAVQIHPIDLSEVTDRPQDATVRRLERLVLASLQFWLNGQEIDRSGTGGATWTLKRSDGSAWLSGLASDDGSDAVKPKFTGG